MDLETLIQTGSDYQLFRNLIKGRKTVIVSDDNIFKLYPEAFQGFDYILLPQGELNKNISGIEFLIEEFTRLNIDRKSLIIGFGGGLITDIIGFAASVFMRGVSFGFIPTTLLAQVDAALGGKNGINYRNYKNYIGTFNQPEFIICDSRFFETLPDIEFKSGLGEVFKYSLITPKEGLFNYLNKNIDNILKRNSKQLNYIVKECVETKTAIVEQDPFDHNIRNILNLGHSFGHCIELINNIPHGIAVVAGINIATDFSVKLDLLKPEIKIGINELANKLGFEEKVNFTQDHLEILLKDKKKENNLIKLILLNDIGHPKTVKFDRDQITVLL